MNETEFLRAGTGMLDAIEEAIDASGCDIDIDRKSDGVLALEFENGSHIIVNLQAPMQQIWIAARAGGFHFALRGGAADGEAGGRWVDTRSGEEFYAVLSAHASAQNGEPVTLGA